MGEKIYHRLAGRGRRSSTLGISATRSTLWLGPDHLLSRDFSVASEEYRRFYYRDIEAFVIRRTAARALWNWFFLAMALLAGTPLFLAWRQNQGEVGWPISAAISTAMWLTFMVINTLRGPSCLTHIRTAVQIENLPSLRRLGLVAKMLERVRPLIEEAQGSVAAEEIAQVDWSVRPAGGGGLFSEPANREGGAGAIRHDSGRMHIALFVLLLFDAASSFWSAWSAAKIAIGLGLTLALSGMIVLVFALRRQNHSDLPAAVKRLTWGTLGYYLAGFVITAGYTMAYPIMHDGSATPTDQLFFRNEPGYLHVLVISGAVALLISIAGLFFVWRGRPSIPAPEAPP